MKYNYHTHTYRCFHAHGEDEEYVKAAIEAGFDEIGFSDHTAWNYKNFVSHMRMHESELKGYCDSIKNLREKYKDKISIKLGLECEYFPQYMPWLKNEIEKNEIDYIILGHHFLGDEQADIYCGALTTVKEIYSYCDEVMKAMETGLFSYVAHPDIFMRGYEEFDSHCEEISKNIISKAIETGTPLEFNLLGYKHGISDGKPGYPHPKFWEIASQMKPKAVVGIDAHKPDAYKEDEHFALGYEKLKEYGLEPIERIKFFR